MHSTTGDIDKFQKLTEEEIENLNCRVYINRN